jgi:hypothetical protein
MSRRVAKAVLWLQRPFHNPPTVRPNVVASEKDDIRSTSCPIGHDNKVGQSLCTNGDTSSDCIHVPGRREDRLEGFGAKVHCIFRSGLDSRASAGGPAVIVLIHRAAFGATR